MKIVRPATRLWFSPRSMHLKNMVKTTAEWTAKDVSKSLYHGDKSSFPVEDYKYVGELNVPGSDDDEIQPTIFLDFDLSDEHAHVVEFYAPWVSE